MKKEPLRMCLICREMFPKQELIRIVKNNNKIVIDTTGKLNGRGAYICKSKTCAEKIKKQRVLNRAFKMDVSDEIYDELIEVLLEK